VGARGALHISRSHYTHIFLHLCHPNTPNSLPSAHACTCCSQTLHRCPDSFSFPRFFVALGGGFVSSLTPLRARRRLVQDPRRVHRGELCRTAIWPGAPAVHTHQSGIAIDGERDWRSSLPTASFTLHYRFTGPRPAPCPFPCFIIHPCSTYRLHRRPRSG
jgi:hypothetical protein